MSDWHIIWSASTHCFMSRVLRSSYFLVSEYSLLSFSKITWTRPVHKGIRMRFTHFKSRPIGIALAANIVLNFHEISTLTKLKKRIPLAQLCIDCIAIDMVRRCIPFKEVRWYTEIDWKLITGGWSILYPTWKKMCIISLRVQDRFKFLWRETNGS